MWTLWYFIPYLCCFLVRLCFHYFSILLNLLDLCKFSYSLLQSRLERLIWLLRQLNAYLLTSLVSAMLILSFKDKLILITLLWIIYRYYRRGLQRTRGATRMNDASNRWWHHMVLLGNAIFEPFWMMPQIAQVTKFFFAGRKPILICLWALKCLRPIQNRWFYRPTLRLS